MRTDVLAELEKMSQNGQPPRECRLFSVGYDDAFQRLERTYLKRHFERGDSAEKFVIGPFGSGKTHFLRRLLETARQLGCVTAEVPLTGEVDYVNSLVVYRQVIGALSVPGQSGRGARALLAGCLARVKSRFDAAGETAELAEAGVNAWVEALESADFEYPPFVRVVRRGMDGLLRGVEGSTQAAERWLDGEMKHADTCKALGESTLASADEKLVGRKVMLSMFQLIRHAGFPGTVLGYDEAEQGFAVDKKRLQKIHSLLQTEINALNKLERGSALIVYAISPDVIEKMDQFMALQQRVADPSPGQGFFDGNTLAPKIDLTQRQEPAKELSHIAEKLHGVFFAHVPDAPHSRTAEALSAVKLIASEVAQREASASARREVVKAVAAYLVRMVDEAFEPAPLSPEAEV